MVFGVRLFINVLNCSLFEPPFACLSHGPPVLSLCGKPVRQSPKHFTEHLRGLKAAVVTLCLEPGSVAGAKS